MSYAAAFALTCLAVLAGVAATLLVQKRVGVDFRRRHHDVGSVVFLQLGVVFAVLLAFVFSDVWGEYNAAAQAIDLEVSAMHGTSILAATLPPADARRVLSAEEAYLESVARQEWAIMAATRTGDPVTVDRLETLIADVADLQVAEPNVRDKRNEMLTLLAEAHTQRESRIFQAGSGIPVPLWFLLVAFTTILTLFVAFAGIESRATSVVMVACFIGCVAGILVIARLLDYPFEGAMALPPTHFLQVADKVRVLQTQGLPVTR